MKPKILAAFAALSLMASCGPATNADSSGKTMETSEAHGRPSHRGNLPSGFLRAGGQRGPPSVSHQGPYDNSGYGGNTGGGGGGG